jgi:Ni/Co efflux regulator RcnB
MRADVVVATVAALLICGSVPAQEPRGPAGDRSAPPRMGQDRPVRPPPDRPGNDSRPGRDPRPGGGQQQGRPPRPDRPDSRPPPRPPVVHHRPPHRFMSQGRWRPSIRGPAFRYPPGFAYRRWTTGALLPPIFLSAPYFYESFSSLGLAPPPPGYRWVRYGSDILLVNVVTGRIADVVDGVFY